MDVDMREEEARLFYNEKYRFYFPIFMDAVGLSLPL